MQEREPQRHLEFGLFSRQIVRVVGFLVIPRPTTERPTGITTSPHQCERLEFTNNLGKYKVYNCADQSHEIHFLDEHYSTAQGTLKAPLISVKEAARSNSKPSKIIHFRLGSNDYAIVRRTSVDTLAVEVKSKMDRLKHSILTLHFREYLL